MRVAVVLFTRDLRVHDHPALAAAVHVAEEIVPLFVFDPRILDGFGAPNRVEFLLDALRREGWMHNRARLVTGSFLTKHLYLDWRLGAEHFFELLVDGDVANNVGNWQWVAGTGADTRPNRMFNPTVRAKRFDPRGAYVRRYVPELRDVEGLAVHEPWKLGARRPDGSPAPIVDHAEAVARFRQARRRD